MPAETPPDAELLTRAEAGDEAALAAFFALSRDRLRRLVSIRMHPRLQGRLDASDVLQEAWLDCARRYEGWVRDPQMPLYLWIRFLTAQKLTEMHRRHLGAQLRDARRELHAATGPEASAVSLAGRLMGDRTSPSQAACNEELRERLAEALEAMDPIDREVLTLRHFEELTNNDVAEVLAITKAGASNRYVRALKRLRDVMEPEADATGGQRDG